MHDNKIGENQKGAVQDPTGPFMVDESNYQEDLGSNPVSSDGATEVVTLTVREGAGKSEPLIEVIES